MSDVAVTEDQGEVCKNWLVLDEEERDFFVDRGYECKEIPFQSSQFPDCTKAFCFDDVRVDDIKQLVTSPAIIQRIAFGNDFFSNVKESRPEIVEGILREGQLVAFGGPYNKGKSPLLQHLAFSLVRGIKFCDRACSQRPVILFDFENNKEAYQRNGFQLAQRLRIDAPIVPHEMEVYFQQGSMTGDSSTVRLLDAISQKTHKEGGLKLIRECLQRKPNALVIIDPLELMFSVDTLKKRSVTDLYRELKLILGEYPHSAIIMTFNMRKENKAAKYKNDLYSNARGWLDEVCGTLDIMNRSDIRLGIDSFDDDEDTKVINGLRRGEEQMEPLLIRSVQVSEDAYAGFEVANTSNVPVAKIFTKKQVEYWNKLPNTYRWEEVVDNPVPKSSLSRLHKRAIAKGKLVEEGGVFHKVS